MLKETLAALDLSVTIGDDVHHPKLKPGDMVRYEQHFGRSLINQNGEAQFGVTELFFLAYAALKREGVVEGEFDVFCDTVDDVDVGDVETGKGGASDGNPSPA